MPVAAKKSEHSTHVSRSAANRDGVRNRNVSRQPAGNISGITPGVVQPKRMVVTPESSFEKEADSTSRTVMNADPSTGSKPVIHSLSSNPVLLSSDDRQRDTARDHEQTVGFRHPGGGKAIAPSARKFMEERFGRSFSDVRIYDNGKAAEMADSIRARAFTRGNEIYFNRGQYQPETEEGRELLAHELTHTIQQKNGAVSSAGTGQQSSEVVQPSLFSRVASSVGSRLRSAAEWVGDSLQAGLNWLRGRLGSMVSSLPGYGLFTVFMGRDPISGQSVERNGRNFIQHGLDVIPFGSEFRQKLEEEGALDEAATWIDQELAALDISPEDIMAQFRQFWDRLSLADVRDPAGVFNRLVAIFSGPVNRIVRFAVNLAGKFLEIVKEYLLFKLREFVENQESPAWYPLLTVVIGRDPIMGVDVDRNGENILTGFIRLHPEGDQQLEQMRETGTFQRAVEWIDGAIVRVQSIASGLRTAFSEAWSAVTDIRSLLNPVGVFSEIYQSFREPVAELISFSVEVASMILTFIKDALLRRLSEFARNTWGYTLLTVLLGKDPFSREVVERTPKNIIRGFMELLPGGLEKFNQLEETGAIDRMTTWISGAVENLNITWNYIRELFTGLWNSFSLRDLANPLGVFQRVISTFAEPVARISAFIWEVIKALVMFGLEVMNFPFQLIRNIVNNAMQAFDDIRSDPIGFFLNLLAAVKQGFVQFFDNITTHLLGGLRSWLFGELGKAGITPPADLSFMSVFGFVLDVLGVTFSNIWARLREKIGPERAQQIESAVEHVTGAWSFVKDIFERGPIAIWEYIQERLSNLWDIVMEQIRNWVVTRIIQRVTARLLSMLDPTGIMAVVNGFITFFKAVQSFIEKLREMLEIVNTFVAGVANVAKGVITQAASYLERALADGIPVAISFLANQVGLGGLGRRVGEMVESIRERVNNAIDWLIDRAMAAGSAVLEMGRSAIGAVQDWWSQRKQVQMQDGSRHEIYFSGIGAGARVMMASTPQTYENYIDHLTQELNLPEVTVQPARLICHEIDELIAQNVSEERQQEHEQTIHSKVDQLVILTAALPLPASGGTNSDPVYGPLRNGFGTFVRVSYMQSPHPMGSSPSVTNTPDYDLINLRREGNGSYYVKGHLLNDNIGGPGNTWSNLTPLTRDANSSHEQDFERFAKIAVNDSSGRITTSPDTKSGHVIDFNVIAEYNRSIPGIVDQLTDMTADEYPPQFRNDELNPFLLARIITAEQYVPSLLRCSVELFDPENKKTSLSGIVINNQIHHGDLRHYFLASAPREIFRLSDHANKSNKEAAISGLTRLNLIGREEAEIIIDSYRVRGQMYNYKIQLGFSKIELEEANQQYRIRP